MWYTFVRQSPGYEFPGLNTALSWESNTSGTPWLEARGLLGPTVEGPGTGSVSIHRHQLLGRRGQHPGSGARAYRRWRGLRGTDGLLAHLIRQVSSLSFACKTYPSAAGRSLLHWLPCPHGWGGKGPTVKAAEPMVVDILRVVE
jgi:hypothetical protein